MIEIADAGSRLAFVIAIIEHGGGLILALFARPELLCARAYSKTDGGDCRAYGQGDEVVEVHCYVACGNARRSGVGEGEGQKRNESVHKSEYRHSPPFFLPQ